MRAEQRRTAMRLFAVMRDNPLFFFMPTEIPIGTLTTHDWSRTIGTLRGLQHRCVRSLSEFVLPAFLDERVSTDAVLAILRATDESGAWGAAAPGAVLGGLDSMVPEALLTAMHDPSSGSRLAAAPGDSEAGLWLRNIQLGLFATPLAAAAMVYQDHEQIVNYGLLQGFDGVVWAVVLLNGCGGLLVAATMKYADNIVKCFAAALAILSGTLLSVPIFGFELQPLFATGVAVTVTASVLYSWAPERPAACSTLTHAQSELTDPKEAQ